MHHPFPLFAAQAFQNAIQQIYLWFARKFTVIAKFPEAIIFLNIKNCTCHLSGIFTVHYLAFMTNYSTLTYMMIALQKQVCLVLDTWTCISHPLFKSAV